MLIDGSTTQLAIFSMATIWLAVKFALIAFSMVYFVFSLIVLRQVNLMTETLITEVAPILRALSIVYAGFSLGIIVLFIGLLFG